MGTLQEALVTANLVSETKVREYERARETRDVMTREETLEKKKTLRRELEDVFLAAEHFGRDWARGELDTLSEKYSEIFDQVAVEYAYALNLMAGVEECPRRRC